MSGRKRKHPTKDDSVGTAKRQNVGKQKPKQKAKKSINTKGKQKGKQTATKNEDSDGCLVGIISGSFLSHIAKQCPQLKQLHLSYLGLTAHCIYTNQLCQAFQHFTSLIDLRLEHAYLSIDQLFCRSARKCRSLQRFCVVSKNGSLDPDAVTGLMSELPRLMVLQLFTDSTQTMCKKLMKALKDRFQSTRPALSVTIYPLFDQDTAYVMNKIPTKHLEELTIFSSKICQQPPGQCRVKAKTRDRSGKVTV
eukprot:XP_019930224.1 PREDICTED: F-box/LRR-repeat protein 18-like [Crassostrea gigas]